MVWSDFWAETSLVCFRIVFAVGMAMSIRMTMMEMTISNSISVKPDSARRRLANRLIRYG